MTISEDLWDYEYRHIDLESHLPVTRLALALAIAKRADLVEKMAAELQPPSLTVCPQAVWRELFSVCAPDTFAAIFMHCLKTPEDLRKPLLAILAGLCEKRPQDPWVARIAAALARMKPVEISKWEAQMSRDPIPPGDIEESRILLAASRRLVHKADIAAAISFLKSDASLFAVRKLIGPLFTGSANKTLFAESTVARELLKFCKGALGKEIARPLVPYPDWRRPCPRCPRKDTHTTMAARNLKSRFSKNSPHSWRIPPPSNTPSAAAKTNGGFPKNSSARISSTSTARPSARERHTHSSAPRTTAPTNTSWNGGKKMEQCSAN
jgi:hypothetical protein